MGLRQVLSEEMEMTDEEWLHFLKRDEDVGPEHFRKHANEYRRRLGRLQQPVENAHMGAALKNMVVKRRRAVQDMILLPSPFAKNSRYCMKNGGGKFSHVQVRQGPRFRNS